MTTDSVAEELSRLQQTKMMLEQAYTERSYIKRFAKRRLEKTAHWQPLVDECESDLAQIWDSLDICEARIDVLTNKDIPNPEYTNRKSEGNAP